MEGPEHPPKKRELGWPGPRRRESESGTGHVTLRRARSAGRMSDDVLGYRGLGYTSEICWGIGMCGHGRLCVGALREGIRVS
jgi:hypothetical protein